MASATVSEGPIQQKRTEKKESDRQLSFFFFLLFNIGTNQETCGIKRTQQKSNEKTEHQKQKTNTENNKIN